MVGECTFHSYAHVTPRTMFFDFGAQKQHSKSKICLILLSVGESRWPKGPCTETPVKGNRHVGAEPGLGGREWTMPKCTYENRVGTLPVRVGSGPRKGGIVLPVHRHKAPPEGGLSNRTAR